MMGEYFDMIDQNNILDFFIKSECEVLTEEEINDPTIPTPKVTSAELYERYRESLPQGTYDPYKTQRAFVHALLLKYLQLYLKAARTTDRKVVANDISNQRAFAMAEANNFYFLNYNYDGFLISDAIDMHAITGNIKEIHVIDTAACIKCGTCRKACPKNAIVVD